MDPTQNSGIAKSKKPHTIGETLVKPCLLKAVEAVLGEPTKKKKKFKKFRYRTIR
jgi:hypothetical protein